MLNIQTNRVLCPWTGERSVVRSAVGPGPSGILLESDVEIGRVGEGDILHGQLDELLQLGALFIVADRRKQDKCILGAIVFEFFGRSWLAHHH